MKISYILVLAFLFSCQHAEERRHQATTSEKHYSPLSSWLIRNEDTLFNFLSAAVKEDTLKDKPEGKIVTREYVFEGGIMGSLNDHVHSVAPCAKIYYRFKPKEKPSLEIFLTPDFDTSCVSDVDSIFSDNPQLKHFKIGKFREPSGRFSKYVNGRDTVEPSDIAFKLIRRSYKYDLIFYSKKPITKATKTHLVEDLLGEEIFLKRIQFVKYEPWKNSIEDVLTVDGLKFFFDVKS